MILCRLLKIVFVIGFLIAFKNISLAQITAPGSIASGVTNYSSTSIDDSIYIFCASSETSKPAKLAANSPFSGNSTFSWERFDTISYAFQNYYSNPNDTLFSQIANLESGCYQVTISSMGNSVKFKAWVINNWIKVAADIPDSTSNCESFQMFGSYTAASFNYYDLVTREKLTLYNKYDISWKEGGTVVAKSMRPIIFDPNPRDTPYRFVVSDVYGCSGNVETTYISKITKADFVADPASGEAPLEVSFSNNSLNAVVDSFKWFFYKSDEIITKLKVESQGLPIDSIDFVLREKSPVYKYEFSGKYRVKLASKSAWGCVDTMYITTVIEVEESQLEVPNVFTPNGDGMNDEFVVMSKSLKSLSVILFDRWGAKVHSWSSGNIQSSDDTYANSVWDGKIGNRMASPGVYYYVIKGVGRDGKDYKKGGFVHLFRSK